MIDESFRMSPVDVRRHEFKKALRGYDIVDVHNFRDRVAEELETLLRQNKELDEKSKALVEQLRAYRERDKALNDALVSAQQLRAEMREQAEREGQLVIREARVEGERQVEQTRAEVQRLQGEISSLERTRRTFITQLRALAERYVQELDAIDAVTQPRGEPVAEQGAEPASPRGASPTPAWLNSLVQE